MAAVDLLLLRLLAIDELKFAAAAVVDIDKMKAEVGELFDTENVVVVVVESISCSFGQDSIAPLHSLSDATFARSRSSENVLDAQLTFLCSLFSEYRCNSSEFPESCSTCQ